MLTPTHKQNLARSPSTGHRSSQNAELAPVVVDERYNRLEDLLRETLALAGEIAETASSQRPPHGHASTTGHNHIPGECIVLRKTSAEPTIDLVRRSSSRHPRRQSRLGTFNDSEEESRSASAAPSMQEPFSPGSLAMSLDAVVEGNDTSDDQRCFENSASLAASPGPVSSRSPTPGSMLGQHDSRSQSVSARSAPIPIPIPGNPRQRPSASLRTSSQSHVSGDDPPSPPPKWHVRIVPIALNREPILPSSPPKTPTSPTFIKLEAVFPYRFFSDGNAAARWSGEGSYVIIGRPPLDECQSPLNVEESEHEFGPATERSLRDFIDDWDCAVEDTPGEGDGANEVTLV